MTRVCRAIGLPSTGPSTSESGRSRRLSAWSVVGVEGVEGIGRPYSSSGEPERCVHSPGSQLLREKTLNTATASTNRLSHGRQTAHSVEATLNHSAGPQQNGPVGSRTGQKARHKPPLTPFLAPKPLSGLTNFPEKSPAPRDFQRDCALEGPVPPDVRRVLSGQGHTGQPAKSHPCRLSGRPSPPQQKRRAK
jgi:hypothetical protein